MNGNSIKVKEIFDGIVRALGDYIPAENENKAMIHCPAHEDKNPSCGVTLEGGKILVHCYAGCSQEAVISGLRERGLWPWNNGGKDRDRPPGIPTKWYGATYSCHWTYLNQASRTVGHVTRFDGPYGKNVIPFFQQTNGKWIAKSALAPRPLYGLDRLAAYPNKLVLIVEGEKTTDAAWQLVGKDYVCITWPGGTNAVSKADWTPLQGREVIIWPDADEPGEKAAQTLQGCLKKAGAKSTRIASPPEGVSKGWDLADALAEGWTRENILESINEATQEDDEKDDVHSPFTTPPPQFPMHVLPAHFAESIRQASKAFSVPLEIPAITLISITGALIGRSMGVVVKPGWTEHPNLFLALVARSGIGKSPCMRAFLRPVFHVEAEGFRQHQEAMARYQEEVEARRRQSRDEQGPPPERPVWKQNYIEDATEEALTDALSGNPRGVLWYHDELSGLLQNLGRYRPGGKADGPKARLMSSYDCGPWKKTRKSGDNAYIRHACLSILGSIQPGVLPALFSNTDEVSGFLPRFLFVRAEPHDPATWTDESFEGELKDRINNIVQSLLDAEMGEDPQFVEMTREAKRVYRQWYNEQVAEPWKDFDAQRFEALSAKLRGQCARLALILHMLESHAYGSDPALPIQRETMQRAVDLADWFKAHQQSTWQALTSPEGITEASPLEKRIAFAIVALEDEIYNGCLPTARITEKVNEGVSKNYRVNSCSVGKAVSKLKLYTRKAGGGKRVVVLTEDNINAIKSATSATPATNPYMAVPPEGGGLKTTATSATYETTQESKESGTCGGSKPSAISGNPHESKENGTCGTCGGYLDKKSERERRKAVI